LSCRAPGSRPARGAERCAAVFESDLVVLRLLFARLTAGACVEKLCAIAVSGGRSRKCFYLFLLFSFFPHIRPPAVTKFQHDGTKYFNRRINGAITTCCGLSFAH
jgi:hypothetical protein